MTNGISSQIGINVILIFIDTAVNSSRVGTRLCAPSQTGKERAHGLHGTERGGWRLAKVGTLASFAIIDTAALAEIGTFFHLSPVDPLEESTNVCVIDPLSGGNAIKRKCNKKENATFL